MSTQADEGARHARALELFDRHFDELASHAVILGCDHAEAEDAAKEAICALMQRKPDDEPILNARAWLYCVTHRQALKILTDPHRRHLPIGELVEHPRQWTWATPEDHFEAMEQLRALRDLDDDYRKAVVLAAQGHPPAQIAEIIDESIDTAKQRVSRGRATMRLRTGRPKPSTRTRSARGGTNGQP